MQCLLSGRTDSFCNHQPTCAIPTGTIVITHQQAHMSKSGWRRHSGPATFTGVAPGLHMSPTDPQSQEILFAVLLSARQRHCTNVVHWQVPMGAVGLRTQYLSYASRKWLRPGCAASRLYSYAPVGAVMRWYLSESRMLVEWLQKLSVRPASKGTAINGEWCCARDASIICCGSVGDIMQSRSGRQ